MPAESTAFRCYYDDGTILINADFCPDFNEQGSPLIFSELAIVENVEEEIRWPWLLLILGLIFFTSKERN